MSQVVEEIPLVALETIKRKSNYLRGTIEQSLVRSITGAVHEDDGHLLKFHGIYQQDDRDSRNERHKQKLEPLYSFMIRVRVPGGVCTTAQWLKMVKLAEVYANGGLRLTTRQTFQFHGVIKRELKATIAAINHELLDTIAACGDVNRNVMSSPNPVESGAHAAVQCWAEKVSEHLTPQTRAYHEIWLNGEQAVSSQKDVEPIYGKTYLPRKFKMVFAIPPYNDVDVFAHDLGFIAIIEAGQLLGFNVSVGGGMGKTHGDELTFPRLADVIGFCTPQQVLEITENTVKIQRDCGDRTNRKHARFKYTIDDRGIAWFLEELNSRLGWKLLPSRPYKFISTGDRFGWVQGYEGGWHLTLFIPLGRVVDGQQNQFLTGLREIAKIHSGDFRITPNQNFMIANIPAAEKDNIEALARRFGLLPKKAHTPFRLHAMACVAFPTCSLAMAEAERYLPTLVQKIESILLKYELSKDAITLRVTGCPNGCARPFIAEIALVGKAPGRYNLYLGGSFQGERLNKLYRENIDEEAILNALEPLLADYAKARLNKEYFGDFVVRRGIVKAVGHGREVHTNE